MGYAFISYSTEDQDIADSFNALLNRNEIKTWISSDNIPAGTKFPKAIIHAIKEASCFVLLFSESAQDSDWVYNETERAVNYGKPIFTIFLDDVQKNDAFELMISSSQAVAIKKILYNDAKINQLIAAIKGCTETELPVEQKQGNIDSESISYFEKNAVMDGSTLIEFKGRDSASVVIPEGITAIGVCAFDYHSELKSISIPSTVTMIKEFAFWDCPNLQSISVSPENSIFRSENNCCIERKTNTLVLGCSKSVIPEGVTAIGENAFGCCENFTEIRIPASVEKIADFAFQYCRNLQSIQVSDQNSTYYSENNCCIEIKTQRLIIGCKNSIVPTSVVSIAAGAFNACNGLTNINLPFGVTEIGAAAFFDCDNLTEIRITSSVTKIAERAFSYCSYLQSIQVSDQNPAYYSENNCCIETKRHRLIIGCKNSIVPKGVISIAFEAFSGCDGLVDMSLPFSVVEIEARAFIECSALCHICIPRSVKSIGESSFFDCCSLTKIVLPDSVSHIGRFAFAEQIKSHHRRKIFCEFSQKPDGWDKEWTDDSSDVYWKDEWYYDENGNPVVKN